jgi:DNA-binding NarL/FixJ family response regulator
MTARSLRQTRVLLVDDHAVLRAGLRMLLDSQPDLRVIGEATDGVEAISSAKASAPDVVVLDLAMPRTDPRTTIADLARLGAKVVVLTMHADRAYVDLALAAGANGYVVKSAADTELVAAIHAVAAGRLFVDAPSRRPQGRGRKPPRARVSPREEAVLRLVALGHTNREAARRLGVSTKTVETFRARAYRKLHIDSRADLVKYALTTGMLSPETSEDLAAPTNPAHRHGRP